MTAWTSVTDKLPKEGIKVLTWSEWDGFAIDYIVAWDEVDKEYIWACRRVDDWSYVTHWMPLPTKPPQEEDNGKEVYPSNGLEKGSTAQNT